MKQEVKQIAVKLSSKGQIVIPKRMRETLGLKAGGRLILRLEGNRIILTPADKFGSITKGIAKGTFGERIEAYIKGERESWERS